MDNFIKKENFAKRTGLIENYNLGHSARFTNKILCKSFGEDYFNYGTITYWFRKLKSGDYNLDVKERSGRPILVDKNQNFEI